jgi:enolase-phosphatase E1
MSAPSTPAAGSIAGIVLDIEGTTTPIAFVYDVLFPFARRRLRTYLTNAANRAALREPLRQLRAERAVDQQTASGPSTASAGVADVTTGQPTITTEPIDEGEQGDVETIARYVDWLMDQDRKSPGLKLLQGQIWQEGYSSGELQGEIFADVPKALRRWRAGGIRVAIYSSASELGQRLLFGQSTAGDLTPLIARFFDTSVGAKREVRSYRRIAAELAIVPAQLLFVSDVVPEIDAARAAGYEVLLCVRPGNHPQPPHDYQDISSFDDIGDRRLGLAG